MPPLLRYTLKNLIKYFWQLVFKLFILPIYKFYWFISKKIHHYFLHNPYLTEQQFKKTVRHNSTAHLLVIVITFFVILSNLHTHEIYAEELNKNSIFAQLFANENQGEIVETSPDINNFKILSRTQKENIFNQLMALKPTKSNPPVASKQEKRDKSSIIAISPSNNALIDVNNGPLKNVISNKSYSDSNLNNLSFDDKNNRHSITVYTVHTGDTLSSIAKKFNISLNTILWENNLSLKSYLQPGDKLNILPINGISYAIHRGDTLSYIAKKFNTSVNKIIAYNKISTNSLLKIGQKIIIPDAKLINTIPRPTKTIYSPRKKTLSPSKTIASTHNFIWPTNSKRITQYYHWRHHAIDIGNRIGQPIYAPISGRVIKAGWSRGYGYNVVIDNGRGIRTRTAHASKLYVKRGQMVKQGEVVAAVGSTGWSTGPHVHFEIMIHGVKVNPLNYL